MKFSKSLITVIVPFYKGNAYIEQLIQTIGKNANYLLNEKVKIELLIVNDSPDETVCYDASINYPFTIKVISYNCNKGIHGARCYGVKQAKGTYIVMLDQDDSWSDTWLLDQYKAIRNNDIAISNAIYCDKKRKEKKYSNESDMRRACNKWILCLKGNQIVSPGQVLIRKNCIPFDWQKYQLKVNGADDYLLWILLFERKHKIAYNLNTYYFHQYTSENVSSRETIMRKSEKEMTTILVNNHLINYLRRMIYKYRFM